MIDRARACARTSRGRSAIATPSSACRGGRTPSRYRSGTSSRYGIWVSTPAPSPVFPSAETAPRWVRRATASSASSITAWLRPAVVATNPVPQASCSNRGSRRSATGRLPTRNPLPHPVLPGPREYKKPERGPEEEPSLGLLSRRCSAAWAACAARSCRLHRRGTLGALPPCRRQGRRTDRYAIVVLVSLISEPRRVVNRGAADRVGRSGAPPVGDLAAHNRQQHLAVASEDDEVAVRARRDAALPAVQPEEFGRCERGGLDRVAAAHAGGGGKIGDRAVHLQHAPGEGAVRKARHAVFHVDGLRAERE